MARILSFDFLRHPKVPSSEALQTLVCIVQQRGSFLIEGYVERRKLQLRDQSIPNPKQLAFAGARAKESHRSHIARREGGGGEGGGS